VSGLPDGWVLGSVDDLATGPRGLTDGPFGSNLRSSHYVDKGPRVIRLQIIGGGVFFDERAHISEEHFRFLQKHEAQAEDVVIAMLGTTLPRACLVPSHLGPAIVKADCVRLRVDRAIATPGFVMAALNTKAVRDQARELVHGVGRPRLGLGRLRDLDLPIAPLGEQRRIVAALDSCFTRLDDAVASLKRVQANLKRYRASVLKAAVEGRLVPTEAELARQEGRDYEPAAVLLERILKERRHRWEEAELAKMKAKGKPPKNDNWKAKYKEPAPPDPSELPELPEGWCWATVDALCLVKGGLTKGKRRSPQDAVRDVPYLRVANVQRGYLDLDVVKTIRATDEEIAELRLQPGDVLLNEGGDRDKLGRGWVWSGELEVCIHQNHVFRARPLTTEIRSKFLSWYGNTTGRRYFYEQGKHTTNLASINLTKLRRLPVPLPPVAEQMRIEAALEECLPSVEAAAHDVFSSMLRVDQLRQAILKWAFEGKLVDQDPNDEPASVLLERIRKEREEAEAKKPKRKARRKKKAKK